MHNQVKTIITNIIHCKLFIANWVTCSVCKLLEICEDVREGSFFSCSPNQRNSAHNKYKYNCGDLQRTCVPYRPSESMCIIGTLREHVYHRDLQRTCVPWRPSENMCTIETFGEHVCHGDLQRTCVP